MRGVRRVFRLPLFRRGDVNRAVDEELTFHLSMREARLRASGLAGEEAARAARARFGDLKAIRQECLRESDGLARKDRALMLIDDLRKDAHFAIRSLVRAKGFAAAIILTLALGIGANTTIFSIINAVVLHPVRGVVQPDLLFELSDVQSYPEFRDLTQRLSNLPLAASSERRIALGRGAEAEHTTGALVTGNYFDVLGVKPALGRLLQRSDDVAGAAPVAVLTHEYWTRALGGEASIIGRTVTVNGAPVTVVGVAPADFRGMHLGVVPAIWVTVHAWPLITPSTQRSARIEERGWGWLQVVGRRTPDVSLEQIHSIVATVMSTLSEDGRDAVLSRSKPRPAQAAALPSNARDGVVRFVVVLAGVVILVLLTACANIAGLMLSRATFREREIGVRIALGAGRFRLVRQLLTESIVLSLAGGVAGLGVFALARAVLARTTLPGGISGSSIPLALNGELLAFAVAIAVVTGVMFGLLPAVQGTRPDTIAALKSASLRRGTWQHYLRGGLVTAQVAVALVLLVGTGLFSRALTQALSIDLGFKPEPLAMLSVDPGLAQLDPERTRAYIAAVTDRVSRMPGITGVSWQRTTPLDSDYDREQAQIEGYTPAPDERIRVEMNTVGAHYHDVMGMSLLSGRGFNERDITGAQPVVVVNETLARRYFAGRDPLGNHISMRRNRWLIVGVVRDMVYHEPNEPARPYAYFPTMQTGGLTPTMVIRAKGDPAALLSSVASAVRSVNPAVPVGNITTMSSYVRMIFAPQVAGAWLLGVFSLLALVVAAVGIYGIVAYAVSQRTREISIRLALGARGSSVLKLIVGSNLAFVALGIPLGVGLALLLARGLSRFLYGVSTSDAITLTSTSLLMLLIGLVAAYLPARRATRIDQNIVLRS